MPEPPEIPGEPASWATSKFYKWFSVFDEQKIKAFFIRNYSPKDEKLGFNEQLKSIGMLHTAINSRN